MGVNVLVLHGPLLDRLGAREPAIYGDETLATVNERLVTWGVARGHTITTRHGADEGACVDAVAHPESSIQAIVMNPGGLTHSSVTLRDAVAMSALPVIEVHLSNLAAREPFRRHSLLAPVASGTICGLGVLGYEVALDAAVRLVDRGSH